MTSGPSARSAGPLSADLPPLPILESELEYAVRSVLLPHVDIGIPLFPDRLREQARAQLDRYAPNMRPAPVETITAWLWPIADAVEYCPSEDEFFRRVASIHLACGEDVPAIAWTLSAQRRALCECERFPSAARVVRLVRAPVEPWLDRIRGLRIIAA